MLRLHYHPLASGGSDAVAAGEGREERSGEGGRRACTRDTAKKLKN